MIAWVVKADRETLDDIATLFCRAGRRIPHRLNALVRHRATNEAANIFDMAIKEKWYGGMKRDVHDSHWFEHGQV